MKLSNKIVALLLALSLLTALAACGSNAASGTENTSDNGATAATGTVAASEATESVDTETAATEDTGTHTVVDHAGNTVEVPNHITRVVIDQIPKRGKIAKVPVVKVKIGPKITPLLCDELIYDQVPVKAEIKAKVSGIYITEIHNLRNVAPPQEPKGFFKKFKK